MSQDEKSWVVEVRYEGRLTFWLGNVFATDRQQAKPKLAQLARQHLCEGYVITRMAPGSVVTHFHGMPTPFDAP